MLKTALIKCYRCGHRVLPQEAKQHPCWQQLLPWLDAKDKVNVNVGEDCALCPPEDQRKIKAGCHVNGLPSCEWCSYVDETVEGFEAGEITPLSPEDIGKLASAQDEPDEDNNPLAGHYCPACGEALEEGHMCAEIDVLAQAAWSSYKAGICPCGNAECDGIAWLLNGKESFEMLEVDL